MLIRALFGGAVIVFLGSTLIAGPLRLSDGLAPSSAELETASNFAVVEMSLGRSWPGLPELGLEERGRFLYPTNFGWIETPERFLPTFQPMQPRRARMARAKSLIYRGDSLADMGYEKPDLFYSGGEVGFVYGRYTGQGGGAIKQGYFIGEIGNDKFRLSVGASFTEDEGRHRNRQRR